MVADLRGHPDLTDLAELLECTGPIAGLLQLRTRLELGPCTGQLLSVGDSQGRLSDRSGDQNCRKQEGERSIERLRAQIPRLTIERGPGAEAATIELDGVSLGASSVGVPVPIDPGPHTLAATAPGYEPYNRTVDIPEGGEETFSIELVKIDEGDTETAVPDEGPTPAATGRKPGEEMRTIAYVVGGVGSVSLLTSGVFFFLMRSKMGDIEEYCGDDGTCKDDILGEADRKAATDLESSIRQYYYLTLGTLGVGLGGLGAATYLYLRAHRMDEAEADKGKTQSFRVEPHAPGADVAGLSVVGRF